MTAAMLEDPDGRDLVAAIHERKKRTALTAADDAYTAAVQAAVAGHGDWASVQVAGNVVRQARAALAGQTCHETTGQTAHQEGTL